MEAMLGPVVVNWGDLYLGRTENYLRPSIFGGLAITSCSTCIGFQVDWTYSIRLPRLCHFSLISIKLAV